MGRRWRTAVLWVGCTLCVLIAVAFVVSAWWMMWVEIGGGPQITILAGAIEVVSTGWTWAGCKPHAYGLRFALVSPDNTLPLIYPFAAVTILTLLVWRFVPKFPRGHCRRCGYNLTGLTEARCPECGTGLVSKRV